MVHEEEHDKHSPGGIALPGNRGDKELIALAGTVAEEA